MITVAFVLLCVAVLIESLPIVPVGPKTATFALALFALVAYLLSFTQ